MLTIALIPGTQITIYIVYNRSQLSRQLVEPNAHSSALKGVAVAGRLIFTTGLDQRLRAWRLAGGTAPQPPNIEPWASDSAAYGVGDSAVCSGNSERIFGVAGAAGDPLRLEPLGACAVEVLEPACLALLRAPRAAAASTAGAGWRYRTAVAGRGLQLIEADVDDSAGDYLTETLCIPGSAHDSAAATAGPVAAAAQNAAAGGNRQPGVCQPLPSRSSVAVDSATASSGEPEWKGAARAPVMLPAGLSAGTGALLLASSVASVSLLAYWRYRR